MLIGGERREESVDHAQVLGSTFIFNQVLPPLLQQPTSSRAFINAASPRFNLPPIQSSGPAGDVDVE